MWFATNRGLAKYDGASFKTFTIKDGLPNNDIWLLDRDYKDRLWYFSKSKYQGFIKSDSVYKFKTNNNTVISPIVYFGNNNIYLAEDDFYEFDEQQIIALNIKSDWVNLQHKLDEKSKESRAFYNPVNKIFIGLLKDKIIFFDSNFKKIKQVNINFSTRELRYKDFRRSILTSNNLLLFYFKDFYLCIDSKKLSIKVIRYRDLELGNTSSISLLKATKKTIQSTLDNNLLIFDKEFNFIQKYKFSEDLNFKRAFLDSKGSVWLVGKNGVYYYSKQQLISNYYLEKKATKKIGVFNKKLIAGVEKEGFYDVKNEYIRKDLSTKGTSIYQIKDNLVVSGFESYFCNKNKLELLTFKSLSETYYSGFKDFIKKDDVFLSLTSMDISKFSNITKLGKSLQRKSGLVEIELFKNEVYAGGSDGLWLLKNDSLVKPNNTNPIVNASINHIEKTNDFLVISTDGLGVYLHNKEQTILLKNTEDLIIQKTQKVGNKLWLATQKGVVEVTLNQQDLANSKITNNFYDADGLLQNNTNDIYVEKDTLYVASDIGIAKINTKNPIYYQKPKLYFKTKKDTLSFSKKARDNISITFGLQDYTNQEYVKYEYRLLPSQEKWTTTQTKILNFSNLSPNNYQLEVKATDQHFNEVIKAQHINVLPNWWQTIIAKIGFGLFGVLCFIAFVQFTKKQIRKKERSKAQLDKKIAGLELQALRSQMNPHFVHNSLNAIQYFIQRNEVELSENYLVKFSKLIRMFFEYSRKQNISIKEEINLLDNYLQIEKLRFEEKLNYAINVDKNIDIDEQMIPSMMLQPIVENAVNHGLFHKKENGFVKILINKIKENSFQVIVEDDGIGILKSKLMHNNSSKNYESKSTMVLEERLELLKQSNDWEIVYKIQDVSEIENATGTRVTLTFNQPKLWK